MTEAQSVSDSREALALQIDAQVDAAARCLEAELAKIANSIQTSSQIADADYRQSTTQGTVLKQKTDAGISRANAQFAMDHAILNAQIERDKRLAASQVLRGQATCDRMVANANTSKLCGYANLDAELATAQADIDIILAANSSKRDAAQVYLDAVKARFNARVQQVQAERVINMTEEQTTMTARRTDLASALNQAKAARENTNRKLAVLKKRQTELQTASMVNWSDNLAKFQKSSADFKESILNRDLPTTTAVVEP